jgi:hypothetical protein
MLLNCLLLLASIKELKAISTHIHEQQHGLVPVFGKQKVKKKKWKHCYR